MKYESIRVTSNGIGKRTSFDLLVLGLPSRDVDSLQDAGDIRLLELLGLSLDVENVAVQLSGGKNKVVVLLVVNVELSGSGRTLGGLPEEGAVLEGSIKGEGIKQVEDNVGVVRLELDASVGDAIIEGLRALVEDLNQVAKSSHLRTVRGLQGSKEGRAISKELLDLRGLSDEERLELAASPLDGVLNSGGEGLDGADGERLISRVALGGVRLGLVREDDLHVSLGTKSSTLQKRLLVDNAALVDVDTGSNVIKSVDNKVQRLEEGIRVSRLALGANLVQEGLDLHLGIHGLDSAGSSGRLGLLKIRVAEKELTVQVRLFNQIIVSHGDLTERTSRNTKHGKVLHHLATNGTSTDHERLGVDNSVVSLLSKQDHLRVVASSLRLVIGSVEGSIVVVGEELNSVEVEPLVEGSKLSRKRLDHLLRNSSSKEGSKSNDVSASSQGNLLNNLHGFIVEVGSKGLRLSNDFGGVLLVPGTRLLTSMLGHPSVKSLHTSVASSGVRELEQVGFDESGLDDSLLHGEEVHGGRNLNLSSDTSELVFTSPRSRVGTQSELVGRFDALNDVEVFLAVSVVDLGQTLNLSELDGVTFFEAVHVMLEARNDSRGTLFDLLDHDALDLLTILVDNLVIRSTIAESPGEGSKSIGRDESDVVGVAVGADSELQRKRSLGQHDASEVLQKGEVGSISAKRASIERVGNVGVELAELGEGHISAILADVLCTQVVLGAEI